MVMYSTNIEAAKAYASPTPTQANLHDGRSGLYRAGGKRVLETLLIVLSAPLILLAMLVMIAMIATDGHNPFYSQLRIGRNGRVFRMWKLRTMVPNADAQLAAWLQANPAAKAEWDATQKLKKDPRITWAGRILRKTSLDELPQLWNVLNGTMALIGPRPIMVQQQDDYSGTAYYRLRPGVTGLWQVSERNEGAFIGRVRFDEVYDRALSPRLDAWIVLRSVGVVLRGTGY